MLTSDSSPAIRNPTDADPPTVFVIDDDEATRASVAALVATMELSCKVFASAEEYLAADSHRRPGCLVLDLFLEGISGEELQQQLAKSSTPIPVVIISGYADVPTVVRCMENGAVTLIEKPCPDDAMVTAITKAIDFDREQLYLSERLQKLQLIEKVLAEREREVLNRVIDGCLNKKIARDLKVSERTVENVRSRLMQKFEAENATDLAAKYTELKLLRKFAHRLSPLSGPHFSSTARTTESSPGDTSSQEPIAKP